MHIVSCISRRLVILHIQDITSGHFIWSLPLYSTHSSIQSQQSSDSSVLHFPSPLFVSSRLSTNALVMDQALKSDVDMSSDESFDLMLQLPRHYFDNNKPGNWKVQSRSNFMQFLISAESCRICIHMYMFHDPLNGYARH